MGFCLLAVLLMIVVQTNQAQMETLEDILVYPLDAPSKIHKRETERAFSVRSFNQFVEEKLIQHSQALEHIIKIVRLIEEVMKKLIANISRIVTKPKLPEKIEVHPINRRSNDEVSDSNENLFVKLGKNLPKYGNLMKDVVMQEIQRGTDPTPLVEDMESQTEQFLSRRSSNGGPKAVPSTENNEISPWCAVAILCRRRISPVCGYDEKFGFGKFEDICHMFQVNCYWKYNFSLVHSCKPMS
ncbi:uncharacterized protein LOC115454007 isoform X2 [Manduca sexta]|nr:uncharacterized protein LOC115454007 isoform X2 [Manduca sexta]